MKTIRNILALLLVLCMALSLCACGENADNGKDTQSQTEGSTADTSETTEETDDGKVTYTVTVVDEGGNPIVGALVQMCLETCYPGATNASGVAEFSLLEDDYKVSFVSMPEGYTADAEEFYFEAGSYDLTITLKAVA